ncbi:hypothetical protein O6H91_20G043200 [Diphasiastrum complanatum]|uniref:Uncharacterized protein n=1 Tax=Diphasiastrum complanatum TaxID=34168 RepID=A0ACC2ARD4_DIPCM|nr:hypothetical protein O6H91_Y104700 [Diphasiastrum complanatum]KAJ7519534.1 hypothetical protein O6H91_20G043200 [Diphasiastrum complanatum]
MHPSTTDILVILVIMLLSWNEFHSPHSCNQCMFFLCRHALSPSFFEQVLSNVLFYIQVFFQFPFHGHGKWIVGRWQTSEDGKCQVSFFSTYSSSLKLFGYALHLFYVFIESPSNISMFTSCLCRSTMLSTFLAS